MKITNQIEDVTPAKAKLWLGLNKHNRPYRQSLAEQYALDMKKGNWLLNHQGIAFDDTVSLIDGQHRLNGVIISNTTVKMFVTRGLPVAAENGLKIFTMDTVDGGKKRTTGDQLALHGQVNGALTAAVCSVIAACATGNAGIKISTPIARGILSIYSTEIGQAMIDRSDAVGLRSSSVIGAIAFAMKSHDAQISEFYSLIVSGEGLFKTGKTSPAYAIRKYMTSGLHRQHANSSQRTRIICATLNAARYFVEGNELSQIKFTSLGLEFFVNHQKSAVAKVCELCSFK